MTTHSGVADRIEGPVVDRKKPSSKKVNGVLPKLRAGVGASISSAPRTFSRPETEGA